MTVIHTSATAAPHSIYGYLFFHVELFTGTTELPKVPISEWDFLVLPCTATNTGKAKSLIWVPLNFTGPPFNKTFIHIQQQAFDVGFCLLSQEQ